MFAGVLHGIGAGIFALLALGLGAWGLLLASRAFGGYQDSHPAIYAGIGGTGFALGLVSAAVAVLLVKSRPRPAAALIAGIALVMITMSPLLFGPLAATIYVPLVGVAALAVALGRHRV